MATGSVRWFNNAKGIGFIRPDDGSRDAFVHYSNISTSLTEDGFRTLRAEQRVEFELRDGPKGPHALNVQALGQPLS